MKDKIVAKVVREIAVIVILLIFPLLVFYSSGGPISGTDLETPINSKMYFWEIVYPYTLNDFGRDSFPNFYTWFYWAIAFISGGSIFISQFLLLSLPIIISYIGIRILMGYFGFRDHVTRMLAIIYALNPAYLAWFTLPLNLSASFIPLCGYCTLQALDYLTQKDKCIKCRCFLKIVLYNAFCYAMLSALFYHYLLWTPLFFTLLWISTKNKKYQYLLSLNFLKKLTIFVSMVLLLLIPLNPRLIEFAYYNLLSPYRGFLVSMTEGTKDLLYFLRENFSYLYILTYSYGTPSERIFGSLHLRLVLFLPLTIFMYLPMLRLDKIRHDQRELYLTSLIISLLVDDIIIMTLTSIDINVIQANQLASILISTIRRPERLLSYFKLLCGIIMLSISIDNMDKILAIKFGKIKTLHRCKLFIAISLTILYVLYVGVPYDIRNESYTQHYVPMPAMYFVFTNIYNKIFSSHADIILHRYFTTPLYSPWISFLWKNYPNIAYSSSFATNYTKLYYSLLINSLINGSKSAMLLLSWSGVRYVIIPADANKDIQSWRCTGKPRIGPSGTHLYGAPPLYEKLFEEKIFNNISYKKFNYDSLKVYEIPSMPTIYIPNKILIIRNTSSLYMLDLLLHLYPDLLNSSVLLIGFDNLKYFSIPNISNSTIAVIIDLKRQVMTTINRYSMNVSKVVYNLTRCLISSKDVVWSKDYAIFAHIGTKLRLLTNLTSNNILYLIPKKRVLLFIVNNHLSKITSVNLKYNIQIISPIKIKLTIHIHNIGTRVIVIPIFLGFSSKNWHIQINSPRYMNIKYILINGANLYGKLWILNLNLTSHTDTSNSFSFIVTLYYNRYSLFLHYLIVSLQILTVALIIVILISIKFKNIMKLLNKL